MRQRRLRALASILSAANASSGMSRCMRTCEASRLAPRYSLFAISAGAFPPFQLRFSVCVSPFQSSTFQEGRFCMDLSIAAILAQDGITTGAIYALLALALVLVFSVTRVIFIPQGEFVSYGALTLAALQTQKFPATCWLLMAMGAACFVVETAGLVRHPERRAHAARTLVILAAKYLLFPVAVYAVTHGLFAQPLPMLAQIALT